MKLLAAMLLMLAQEAKVEFEVASIKLGAQDNSHSTNSDKGIYRTRNVSLKSLMAQAYDIDRDEILGGPPWVEAEGYDINAKIPEEFSQQTKTKLPLMLQSLLADRFGLVIHREPRQISGFFLVVAKSGVKMTKAGPEEKGSSMNGHNTHLTCKNVSMEQFARSLTRDAGKLVVDRTGLPGGYDFELDWAPDQLKTKPDESTDTRPSIFTALQEQLGLRLESAKVPVSAIVIDRATRPEGN